MGNNLAEKQKRKRKPWTLKLKRKLNIIYTLVSTGLLVLLGVVACVGCFLMVLGVIWHPSTLCFGTLFPTEDRVAEETYITLSDSAHNIEYQIDTGGRASCTIWLQFDMSPEDLEIFQNSTQIDTFETRILTQGAVEYFLQEADWEQSENALSGYSSIHNQWIFIDSHDSETLSVYIIVYEAWH